MLALLGIVPVLLAGWAIAAAFAALAASCNKDTPAVDDDSNSDDDSVADDDDIVADDDVYIPPDDDVLPDDDTAIDDDTADDDVADDDVIADDDIADDDVVDDDVMTDDDFVDDDVADDDIVVDDDVADDDIVTDDDVVIDDDSGDDDDFEPSRAGVNFSAALFDGPIYDLDPTSYGIRAFGGTPPKIWHCAVDGIGPASCSVLTELPDGVSEPVNYFEMPSGYSVAVSAPPATGNPFEQMFFGSFGELLELNSIEEVVILGLGTLYEPSYPSGLAVHHSTRPSRDRVFMSTRNFLPAENRFIPGTVLVYADEGEPYGPLEQIGFPNGVNTSALTTTVIDPDGAGARELLVAFNAGDGMTGSATVAGITVFDPEPFELARLSEFAICDCPLATLRELSLSADGKTAFAVEEGGSARAISIHLETGEIGEAGLSRRLMGRASDAAVGGGGLYISDDRGAVGGAVIFVSVGAGPMSTLGTIPLNDAPTAVAFKDGYIYVAAGSKLVAIDTSTAELDGTR